MSLLNEANEMFEQTGCLPDADGEPVRAETIVPDAKAYISETIGKAIYDPAIWQAPAWRFVVSWLAQSGIEGVKYSHLGEPRTRRCT